MSMPKIYTSTDLVCYLFQETTTLENAEIANQLQFDTEAAEELEQFQQTLLDLKECELDPHPTSVNIIMEYSARLHEPAH